MSEYSPFGADDEASAVVEEAATGNRKLLAALGALAVTVVGAGAFLLLGGDTEEQLDTPVPAARAAAPAAAAAATAAKPGTVLPAAADLSLGRNPFRALYIQPAPAPPAPVQPVAAPVPVAPTVTIVPTVPMVPTAPTAPTTDPGTGVAPPSSPTSEEFKLILLRVFGEGADLSASFSIDGAEQTARVGSTFGPHAEILLLELTENPTGEWTATLQVGDGDPFDVATGDPTYVR